MRVVCGGGIGAEIFAVFGGGVCRGVLFWSGSGGAGDFLVVKKGLVRELAGGTSKR